MDGNLFETFEQWRRSAADQAGAIRDGVADDFAALGPSLTVASYGGTYSITYGYRYPWWNPLRWFGCEPLIYKPTWPTGWREHRWLDGADRCGCGVSREQIVAEQASRWCDGVWRVGFSLPVVYGRR